MRKCCFFVLVSFFALLGPGRETIQASSARRAPPPAPRVAANPGLDPRQVEMANLRADVQNLDRRVRELNIAVEVLTEQNRKLSEQLERQHRIQTGQTGDMIRPAQLNQAINDLQRKTEAADAELRRQIIREVTQQIEQLGKQTQDAIDALARNGSSRPSQPVPRTNFSEDFPKEGVSYTVQRGDTLSRIASRHNSTVRDIQNANQISDPTTIQVGQTLFIPQRNN